jgi:hypothetical protein
MGLLERFLAHTWMEWCWALILPAMYFCAVLVWRRDRSVAIDVRVLALSIIVPLAIFTGSVHDTAHDAAYLHATATSVRVFALTADQRQYCTPDGHPAAADVGKINRDLRADDIRWRSPPGEGNVHGRKLGPTETFPCDLIPYFNADDYVGYSGQLASTLSDMAGLVRNLALFVAALLVCAFFPGMDSQRWKLSVAAKGAKAA